MKKVLKKIIVGIMVFALYLSMSLPVMAAHSHTWTGESLLDQYFTAGSSSTSCNVRVSVFLKTCTVCGVNSTRTVKYQMSHSFVASGQGKRCQNCGMFIGPSTRSALWNR